MNLYRTLYVLVMLIFIPFAHAEVTNFNAESKSNVSENNQATVTILNRKIITFHNDLLGLAPVNRARRAELVINEHLKHSKNDSITILNSPPIGKIVKVGEDVAFFISQDDINAVNQISDQDLVITSASALKQAMLESRQSDDIEFMLSALMRTLLAIIVFISICWVLRLTLRNFEKKLFKFAHSKKINLGGAEAHIRSTILYVGRYGALSIYWLLVLLISYQCLTYVLEQFPQTRAWGEQLHGYLLSVATSIYVDILHSIPNLFIAFIIFLIARFIAKGMNTFFNSVASGETNVSWVQQDVAMTTKRIVNAVIWLFAFVMAYPYLPGSGTEAFKGMSVLVGIMLSLGASSLVSQAGSGLILTYTRMFRMGDYVSIGDHEGTVVDLGMFTTRIRDGMGVEFAFPNSYILSNVTKNYSQTDQISSFIMDATVTIGYDTPWRQVHALLIQAALKTSGVLAEPIPAVYQTELSDFYPKYKLVCHATPLEAPKRVALMSELHSNIQDLFNEYGVQIMSPHYYDDPKTPKVVPENQWIKAPAKSAKK